MGTQARWRLVWMVALAVVLAGVSAGLLCAAERAKPALPEAAVREAKPDIESLPSTAGPEVESTGTVRIAAPEPGAKLRGLAVVEVEWEDPRGYVIFRVGDRFTYATTQPYEMRWDTSTTLDGRHIVSADAYDGSGGYAGTSSISVIVENAIPTPPEGILLTVLFDEHDLMAREIVARGELSSLGAGEALPAGFDVLGGDLRCTLNQSVMDAFYEGASTLVRNRLRIGALVVGGESRTLPEVGLYAMVQISRNGLAIPATAATTKPRLGLGEVSAALRDYDTEAASPGAEVARDGRRGRPRAIAVSDRPHPAARHAGPRWCCGNARHARRTGRHEPRSGRQARCGGDPTAGRRTRACRRGRSRERAPG